MSLNALIFLIFESWKSSCVVVVSCFSFVFQCLFFARSVVFIVFIFSNIFVLLSYTAALPLMQSAALPLSVSGIAAAALPLIHAAALPLYISAALPLSHAAALPLHMSAALPLSHAAALPLSHAAASPLNRRHCRIHMISDHIFRSAILTLMHAGLCAHMHACMQHACARDEMICDKAFLYLYSIAVLLQWRASS